MNFAELIGLAAGTILLENFIFAKHPSGAFFLKTNENMKTAAGVGLAVTLVMGLSSVISFPAAVFFLTPLHLEYLEPAVSVLAIAALVYPTETLLRKAIPALYTSLGITLPHIAVNCAVLGAAALVCRNGYGFMASAVTSVGAGLGYTLALVLLTGIRGRLAFSDYPKAFEGAPIFLVTAGVLALCFMGVSGLRFW